MSKNNKMRFYALLTFLVSPVYVPAVICWEHKDEIIDFYVSCWQIAIGTYPQMEKKQKCRDKPTVVKAQQ